MSQIRYHVTAPQAQAEHAARMLELAFEEDGWPVAAFEVDEDAGIWSISVYAGFEETTGSGSVNPQRADLERRMTAILAEAGVASPLQGEILPAVDWVAATLRDLSPVRAGRFVVHGSHDRGVARAHEYGLLIDAGLAFGTGHHGTTAGCLDMITASLKRRRYRNALDLGTGSGVLAIALARSTTARVTASDIDPVATKVAAANSRINHVHNRIACVTAAGFANPVLAANAPYDLVVANILAGPLQALARDFARHLAPRATIILSGLLPHQRARICATYRHHGLHFVRRHIRDGWLTLVLEKRR